MYYLGIIICRELLILIKSYRIPTSVNFLQFAPAPSFPHKYKFSIVFELQGPRESVPSKCDWSAYFTSALVACGKIKQHLYQCVAQKNVRISYFIV